MLKSLSRSQYSWLGYLNTLDKNDEEEELCLTGFDQFLNANLFGQSFFRHSIPFVYLLDYRKRTYINMSDNFAGYNSEAFLSHGIDHLLEIYHPDHMRVFDQEIFPSRLNTLEGLRPEEYKNIVFSLNLRIKHRSGHYENYLQRNCFIPDSSGKPIFSMGILININHHQHGNRVIDTIEKIDPAILGGNKIIFRGVYHLKDEDKLFSKREKEVLLWMSDGLSSKMIARKLSISENTVINHRRNMQDKSNMPNATALVSFAIRNELI